MSISKMKSSRGGSGSDDERPSGFSAPLPSTAADAHRRNTAGTGLVVRLQDDVEEDDSSAVDAVGVSKDLTLDNGWGLDDGLAFDEHVSRLPEAPFDGVDLPEEEGAAEDDCAAVVANVAAALLFLWRPPPLASSWVILLLLAETILSYMLQVAWSYILVKSDLPTFWRNSLACPEPDEGGMGIPCVMVGDEDWDLVGTAD